MKNVRPSGYVSRSEEIWYALGGPLYDLLTWWCFLPIGGELACRREFVRWFDVRPGHEVLSLGCGTGTTDRILLRQVPEARILGIDLGAGQVARARKKDLTGRVEYREGDASRTELPDASFDRVLITLMLHEMPRELRLDVLREARRVCKATGRVVAVEHAPPPGSWTSRLLRALWWFYWLPGNPELSTTKDLQERGLANEMREAGLEVICRYCTRLDWIEGVAARPL